MQLAPTYLCSLGNLGSLGWSAEVPHHPSVHLFPINTMQKVELLGMPHPVSGAMVDHFPRPNATLPPSNSRVVTRLKCWSAPILFPLGINLVLGARGLGCRVELICQEIPRPLTNLTLLTIFWRVRGWKGPWKSMKIALSVASFLFSFLLFFI